MVASLHRAQEFEMCTSKLGSNHAVKAANNGGMFVRALGCDHPNGARWDFNLIMLTGKLKNYQADTK